MVISLQTALHFSRSPFYQPTLSKQASTKRHPLLRYYLQSHYIQLQTLKHLQQCVPSSASSPQARSVPLPRPPSAHTRQPRLPMAVRTRSTRRPLRRRVVASTIPASALTKRTRNKRAAAAVANTPPRRQMCSSSRQGAQGSGVATATRRRRIKVVKSAMVLV